MATVQDLLDRTLGKRGTVTTEPTQISNATLTERAGVGTFIPQLPQVLNDQRQNNIAYEQSKVDHANPLLTTANLNNSNPLISVPANALNMAGSVVANTIQGGRNIIGLGHEFVAKYHEAGLPEEAAVMQGSADSIEAELSVLRKELENPTVSGNPGARMKLIADITKKRAELIRANDSIRQSGYKDQLDAVKHNRKMGQLYADRTQGNSPDVLWNNKQRQEVNARIEAEINQWKKENPDANFAEETAAASRITAGHLADNPTEIIGSAVDSVAALLSPQTILASAASQGSNFLIQQQEKYNEKRGVAGESLIPADVQAGIAAGTAAYVGLNFYADKVLANAAGLSKSPVDKAVEAATEVIAKGGTKAAAARTAEKVAAPTVKGAIATGVLAAAQEYPVEGISAMMEENLGHGDWTFDGTVFGRGGTQGVMAGGVIAAPSTAANTLEAASAQMNIKASESVTDTSSKKYNPVADIAQAYSDVVESGAAATPEQVTAARDKAKTVLATTQERLDNLLQIKQDIKETDLTAVLAQRMDAESDSIQARFDNGEIDEATATSLMEGLDKKYNDYAAEVVKYRGKESKLDNELRIVRNNLQASTQYHTKMSEDVGLAPDTVKAIQDRQKIIESRTATPEDIARAIEDIIAYPMVATTKQIEQVVASGNLTPEVEKILRTISASKQLLQGDTSSEVRKQIEHGAQGYRGLREYNEAFNVALIDGDEKAIARIQRGLDSFLQSHTTKQQAISDALNQVPNGTTWQVARDKDYNWYIRKDNLFSEEKRKSYGAFNVHKGSGKLLKDVTEEVALIQAQIDLVKASLELRQQAPVQPQDMTNYNKIKYSQKTPLTHAEAQAKVAKLEAALSPENKTFAVGRDGNLHPVQVKRLHASDASKVIVSIDDSGKEYSPKLDDLVVMDQNGNDLFAVAAPTETETETEITSEPVELDPQETSWDNLDEPTPSDQDGDIEYDYTPTDIDYGEPVEVTSTEPTSEPTATDEHSVAETEPTQPTETSEASETEVTGQNNTTQYSAANVTQELPVSDYVKSHIQTMRDIADKLGITSLIEDLAAQGKVASEIYSELAKDQLKSMNRKDAMDVIRATRTSLGIPSQEAGEEANNFQEWLKDYNKRKAAESGKASDTTSAVAHLDNYPEQANKPLDQWDHNDFASVGMFQRYTGGDETRLSIKEESQANRLIAKMMPKIIKRGVESGKSTSEIMQEVFELADKDYSMRQSGVVSLRALIERERAAVQQSNGIEAKASEETTELTYLTVPTKLLNTSVSLHDPELKKLVFKIKGKKGSSGNLNYLSELYDSLVEAADDSTGIHIFTDVDSIPLDHIKELADTEQYSNGHTTFYVRIPELGDIPMIFIDLRDGGELLSKASNPQEVIIHEIHHVITKENLEISSEIQDEINNSLKPKLVAHIGRNRERLEKEDPRTLERLEYMLTSMAEFLTVGTTEYGVIQELKKIPVPVEKSKAKTSMFTRLVQLVGKLVGVSNEVTNMYEKLLDQTAQLKEQSYVENQGELSNLTAVEEVTPISETEPTETEVETETETPTVQRTVKGSFYLDDSDNLTEGTIDIADGSVTVRVGNKELTVKVTPEQVDNESRLAQAIARADSSIVLAYANDLVPKEVQLARAQEIYRDDVSMEEIQQLNLNAEDEILSREDGSYDEVKVDDAKGLLGVFLDEASTFAKNFRQVGSKLYAKPFITIKDFFPSLDWNAPSRAEYLAQLLSSDTSKLDDHDFTTMKALRDFHMGMAKGSSFRDVVLDRLNSTEQLNPKLNLASHLVIQTEDGKLAFEENVLGAMSVAAYDYILKNQDMLVNSDAGINFMLSIPVKDSFIKGAAAEKYRRSTTLRDKLIYELGESVTTALGIKVNNDVSPDELRKLNSALGIYVYDAMKGRFITENVVYEHQILTDVVNHIGYTVARDRYNGLMEAAGVGLAFKDFRKLHKQYVETIKENRIGYISQKGGKPEGILDFATKVTKNIPRIPTFRPENLVGDPKEVQAFIELAQQLRAAHGVLNTPKYLAGIAQDQKAIDNNKRQRKNPNYKPQQELALSVSKVAKGVPPRSETIHKIFGLDKSLITPLSAPVRFLQRTIKKSLAEVSDAQAKALDVISQKPLKIKPFTSVVSSLAKKDYDLLKEIIGANPALDTIHVSHRDNAVAKAANTEHELELALSYVDSITNEDGSYNNFYHELVVWSNNRFGYRSNTFNLQTSKIARSMSTYVENVAVVKKTVTGTSTRSIFNKDKKLTEYGKLLHGVAVYAEDITAKDKVAFPKNYLGDTTIDKAPNEVLLPLLHKRLTTEFKDHFDAVRKLVNNENLEDMDRTLIIELVSEMGAGIQSLEAAVELVRYWDTPKGKTFESHLTVESDGITNGMIINQIQNGTATLDMLVQAGILTDAELADNPDTDFFQLKGYGWMGNKLTDYYVRAGNHQKENWEKLKEAMSLETFDENATEDSNVVSAIAFIDSTFGERKGAKAFATPDNYAAGLGRIKEIVGEYFTDNLIGSIEKSINKNDPEKLGTIMKHVDTLLKFHDTYLTSPDMVNLIYKKGGVPTLNVTVPDGMSQKQLRANLAKRAVLMANSTGAEQGKVFQLKAKDLNSYREMIGELSKHFSANILKTFRIESLEPVTDMNMGQLDYRLGMIIAATKHMFSAVPVGTLDYNFINTMSLSGLMDVKFITDEQMSALNAVSNITQGTATVLALKEMNGKFYRVREANLDVMNAAYRVHQVIRTEVINQAISRRLTKVDELPENYKEMDAESLLTVNDWKEINQILSKFLPTGQTAFSRKSKNAEKSGAVFLDEGNKLFTSETYTQEVAITKDGKTTKYKTGVYKPVDKPVGLKGNSSMTQSVDAYVTTNASTKVISGNFHDSNGYNIASYQEGAKAQNEVFFEALVNHSAQNGFAEAILNPLKAFLEDSTISKSENVIADLNAVLTGKNDISEQILTMYNAELDRLSLLSAVSRVQQYGTEDGHYDVPQEVRDQIQEHLDKQRSDDAPMIQLVSIISDLRSKVKNPSNPSSVYTLNDVDALVEQEMVDYDSGSNNPVVQGLRDLGSTNIPASKVVGLIKEHLNNHEGGMHPFYSQLIDLVEAALPSGIEVNVFTPTSIPKHVRGDRVLQYERDTQGWFTGNQVNLVYSARNELTVETLVHELVHAALVNHVKKGLKGKDKNPAATDLVNLMANVRGALEADPRFADIVSDYQVALHDVHEFVSYGITNQRFMNALKSVYIPQTSQHKSNSKHSLAKRLVNAFSRFTELAVELLLGKTPKYKGKGKDAHINALAALTTTVALNLQEASMSNAKPDMDFDTVLQHVANANTKSKEKIKLMTPTQVYEKLNTGNLSSSFDQQLRTEVLPLIETIAENISATEVGKMFKESVNPETIWDDAQVNNKVPYVSNLLSMGFPLSDKEAYTVEILEASLNAIIDYSYGSTVHREMDRMYIAARNSLKPEHFHEGDWATATIREKIAARERWDQLFNLSENMDNERRNRFLTRFMALSLGSEHFNKILDKVPPTQDVLEEHDTVHGFIANRFHRFIDWLAQRAARTGNIPTIQGRIKVLAEQLAEIDAKRKNHLMHKASKNPFANLDALGEGVATAVRNSIVRLARLDPIQNSSFTAVKLGSESLQLLVKNNLEEVPDQIMKLRANMHPNTLPGFLAETAQEMGRPTGLRKKLISMISRNNAIQRERETMRQHIEKNITEMFVDNGEYLETEDWKAITNVILRTGLSRLYFEEYEPSTIFEFISSNEARRNEINALEEQVLQLADGSTKLVRTKQLADYMVTGIAHELQAKNTLQIAGSVGVSDSSYIPDWFDSDVKLLNRLVSLYAIEYSNKEDINRIKKVIEKESLNTDNGVERLLNFHQKLGNDSREMFKDNPLSQAQAYVPEIHNTNREIAFAAHDGDVQEMVKLGYQEVTGGILKKAEYDTNDTPVRLMYTMNSDKQRIVDGVAMLNTTDGKGTEIAVEDIQVVTKHLAHKLRKTALHRAKAYDPRNDREVTHGVPQLNAEGEVVGMAYEMTNALRDTLLERDNHPAKLMGEYAASNLDLQNVEKINFPVMDALFQDYQFNYKERPQDYVELSHDSDNPELVRMYRMLPYTTREYLKGLYGDSPIMVNANVLTITLGYRKYTPTEIFRKNPDERNVVEATFAGMMQAMFQDKAAVRTTQALKATMEIVKLIKDFYVIRNFTTLFNNILSNNAVLLAYGVTPLALARDTKVALQAGLKFKKDYSMYIQYKTKVALGLGDMTENKQKMMYYEDSLQRNPLKAFIDEGMMTSIVEDIEQSKDDYSYQAALENKFKGTIEAIPKPIRETVNFVMVNQGTPLHRMLTDTTAMSDFVAKYVLYNYHTKKKGMSHAEAIFESHEAFINYEVPTNKTLQFLNDIGLVMFTKYALRIQRVVYRLLRDRPASTILQTYLLGSILGMPTALDGFIPNTGNLPFSGSITEAFNALGEPIPLKLIF